MIKVGPLQSSEITNSTFDKAPKALNGIRVDFSDNIDLLAVIDSLMGVTASAEAVVGAEVVCKDHGVRQDVLFDESSQCIGLNVVGDECPNLPLALDHSDNGSLVCSASACSLGSASVVGLVHFDLTPASTNRPALVITKHGANLLKHAPRRLVSHTRFPLNLLCRNSAARRGHQVDGIEPSRERRGGLVEDRASGRVNVMPAMVARVGRATLDAVMLCKRVARFAEDAVRVEVIAKPIKASRIVRELLLEVFQRVRQHVRFAVVVGHDLTYFQVKT